MTGCYLRLLCSGLCLLCSSLAAATVQIGVDAGNPPFMYAKDDHGEAAQGLYPDLIRAVFARMRQPVTLHALPWKRVLLAAEQGGQGIGGLYMNGERLRWLAFSDPLYEEQIVVYTLHPMTGKPRQIRRLADLYGLRVGVLDHWFYSDEFSAATRSGLIQAQPVSSDRLNLRKLLAGRVDAVLAIRQSGDLILRELPTHNTIDCSPQALFSNQAYLAFPRQDAPEALLQQFNTTLRAMQADGSYARLLDNALSPDRSLANH